MPNYKIIPVIAGTDFDYAGTAVLYGTSTPYTGFVADDVITALVYPGGDQTVTFAPDVAWVDATLGTYVLSLRAADTATVTPGRYIVRIIVTRAADSRVIPVYQAWLEILESPGDADPPTVYCSLSDLLLYAPWLEQEQTVHALAGFISHRHLARTWLESIIQAHWLQSGATMFGDLLIFYLPNTYGAESKWLQQQLDADLLMIKPATLELVSRKSIQLIAESCISPSTKDQPYRAYAREQKWECDRLVKSYIAELDLNDDGIAEIVIECGRATLAL